VYSQIALFFSGAVREEKIQQEKKQCFYYFFVMAGI